MTTAALNYDQLESISETATVLGMTIAIVFRPFIKKVVATPNTVKISKTYKIYHCRILALALFTMLKALAGIFYDLGKAVKSIQGTTNVISAYDIFTVLD
ncbi:hypothetical protein HK103_003157, partial [Boothiomyces macroporosus]